MNTLEQKIDIILRYIATEDETEQAKLREAALDALQPDITPAPFHEDPEDILDDIIEDLLKEIGVPCHIKGHERLFWAIKFCYTDKAYMEQMTKMMYPAIAARCDTTSSRVERAIRHAIECVWNDRDLDNALAIFGNTISVSKAKPTNGEFISTCVKEVERRMKNR